MQKISIVGVPMDLGVDRRGVDMGPSALRYADLNERLQALGHDVHDMGDLDVIIPETRQFVWKDGHLSCLGVIIPSR